MKKIMNQRVQCAAGMLAILLMPVFSIVAQEVAPEVLTNADIEKPVEPNYFAVAEAARKIADDIGTRLIPTHMEDAESSLKALDGNVGYIKTKEAYVDMEEMISFCESTKSGASNCPFSLKISMSMGNTMGQLGRGMKPGQGSIGGIGQGSSGYGGNGAPFALYGPDSFGKSTRGSSEIGNKKKKGNALADGERDRIAGNVDELNSKKNTDIEFSSEGESHIMEEYRAHTEQYFKRLAEKDPK